MLTNLLGKQGRLLWEYTNGLDNSPVCHVGEEEKIKSVGNGVTFTRDLVTEDDIITAVTSLSDTVAGRLRRYGMKAFGVKVDIKDPYFKVISRQKQLFTPTDLAEEIVKAAMELIHTSWRSNSPIRMLTVTAINLTDEDTEEQISLFAADTRAHIRGEKIERTMDQVREKFGSSSIGFAAVLDNDIGAYVRDYNREDSDDDD
jgi:DNA polymerase-4